MDLSFTHQAKLFLRLSHDNITDLMRMRQSPNFFNIIALLDDKRLHDFNLFKQQAETYIKMNNINQVKACLTTLKGIPLSNWLDYKNAIMATEIFLEEDDATEIVKDVIKRVLKYENIQAISDPVQAKLEELYEGAFLNLNKKIILSKFQWQKELVIFLAYLLFNKNKKNILITLGTGHGKSVVIQLLADILQQSHGDVNVVTLNKFLAYWGRKTYCSASDNISYLEVDHLMKKTSCNTTHVIYDEIDQMIGENSFRLLEKDNQVTASYTPCTMKQWRSVIGFSGTISQATIDQLREELNDPICIEIPSLRKKGATNILSEVKKVSKNEKNATIIQTIKEKRSRFKNFIIVMKDLDEAQKLINDEELYDVIENKKIVDFLNFRTDYAEIQQKLKMLTKDNFVVVTTKEGGRGVDYKGLDVAHVIVAFDLENLSQAQQCIGRVVREINTYTEGTIICENPPTQDPSEYFAMLEARDAEKAEGMQINCKVARMLNNQTHKISDIKNKNIFECQKSDAHLTMIYFKGFMERGQNFLTSDEGQILWKYLREIDSSGNMPIDPYLDWKQ